MMDSKPRHYDARPNQHSYVWLAVNPNMCVCNNAVPHHGGINRELSAIQISRFNSQATTTTKKSVKYILFYFISDVPNFTSEIAHCNSNEAERYWQRLVGLDNALAGQSTYVQIIFTQVDGKSIFFYQSFILKTPFNFILSIDSIKKTVYRYLVVLPVSLEILIVSEAEQPRSTTSKSMNGRSICTSPKLWWHKM